MFEAKIERAGGVLSIMLKSEPLEALMKGLAADRKVQVFWADGTVSGPGLEGAFDNVTRWDVKASKLTAIAAGAGCPVGTDAELITGGTRLSLLPLTFKGLGQGVLIKPATPYHIDHLKAWAKGMADITHAILTSVQPVTINVEVRPRGQAPNPEPRGAAR